MKFGILMYFRAFIVGFPTNKNQKLHYSNELLRAIPGQKYSSNFPSSCISIEIIINARSKSYKKWFHNYSLSTY